MTPQKIGSTNKSTEQRASACRRRACWPFLRLVTNARVFERPESIAQAWQQVRDWLACDSVWIPQPTERHVAVLDEPLSQHGVHANLVPDAHLAALAIEHGLTLCSTDGDFARFSNLRWLNPLA
jgi:uncharacterized protein